MKSCPSCSREVDNSADACPHCGHRFPQGGAKRTMLGLPALNQEDVAEDDIFGLGTNGPKATQFGLPAQSREVDDDDSEPDWDDDYDATSIVPAAELNARMAHDGDLFGADSRDKPPRSNTGGKDTAAGIPGVNVDNQRTGMLPSPAAFEPDRHEPGRDESARDDSDRTGVAHPKNFNQAWGLDEKTDGSSTDIASASSSPADMSGGFAQFVPPKDKDHNVGTLLGMSLEEVEQREKAEADARQDRRDRSTQFALPAAQREPDPSPAAESSDRTAVADADAISQAVHGLDDDSEGDAPTMAWNPAEDPEFEAQLGGDSVRKSKLEQLRAKRHLLKRDRDTAQGIPSAKKSDSIGPTGPQKPADPRKQAPRRPPAETPQAQDGQRTSSISAEKLANLSNKTSDSADANAAEGPQSPALQNRGVETPSSGVLKVPKRTNPPGSLRTEDTGLLGKSSYSKSRDEVTSDNPAQDGEKVPVTDGPVAGVVPTPPARPNPPATVPESSQDGLPEVTAIESGLEEQSWKDEYAYDETGIAPADTTPGDSDLEPSAFKASQSAVNSFSSASTGTKFPTAARPADEPFPAQRNAGNSQPPTSDDSPRQSESPQAREQKKGLSGVSPTDLFSDLPDSVNTTPTGAASNQPSTGAMAPGEGPRQFDYSPTPGGNGGGNGGGFGAGSGQWQQDPRTFPPPGQLDQSQPFPENSGFVQQPESGDDGVVRFVSRAQSAFGILGGFILLAAIYLQLRPFAVPEEDALAISLAMTALAGIGALVLSLFPVSPGLRGIAFAFLSMVALGGLGLVMAAAAAPNIIVVVLLLAGAGLTFVAAIFPVIGKLVS